MSPTPQAPARRVLEHAVSASQGVAAPAPTTILITEPEVNFATAAAVPLPRRRTTRPFAELLRRLWVAATPRSHPRRRHYPDRDHFLESSRMAREMLRL